jgi:hypothetical protein
MMSFPGPYTLANAGGIIYGEFTRLSKPIPLTLPFPLEWDYMQNTVIQYKGWSHSGSRPAAHFFYAGEMHVAGIVLRNLANESKNREKFYNDFIVQKFNYWKNNPDLIVDTKKRPILFVPFLMSFFTKIGIIDSVDQSSVIYSFTNQEKIQKINCTVFQGVVTPFENSQTQILLVDSDVVVHNIPSIPITQVTRPIKKRKTELELLEETRGKDFEENLCNPRGASKLRRH